MWRLSINVILITSSIIFASVESAVLRNGTTWKQTREDVGFTVTDTEQGPVQGRIQTTFRGKEYYSFRGIPFATPPVGPLRFTDPIPNEPWTEVLQAIDQKPECVQPPSGMPDLLPLGSEDCLYLNVFSPDMDGDLPVYVDVHGGGFSAGSNSMTNENVINEDLVLVTLSYRLGVFGFLSLGTADVPGNAGMKDLVLGMKWVRENIRHFGGNPDRVTIAGNSAGGASVSHLQTSPMALGLFHNVIAQSGTSLADFSLQRHPEQMNAKLAAILNLSTTNAETFAQSLREIDASTLATAAAQVEADQGGLYEDLTFVPVVEEEFTNVEAFYNQHPIHYIENGLSSDVPTILGYASKEYFLFWPTAATLAQNVQDDLLIVPDRWRLEATTDEVTRMAELIREHYIGGQSLDVTSREQVLSAVDLFGDVTFIQPVVKTAKILTQHLSSSIYLYRYSFRGAFTFPAVDVLGGQGASHADEMMLFLQPIQDDYSIDGWVNRKLVKLFTNFCKTGNPTPPPISHLLPRIWEPVTEEVVNYLDINNDIVPSKNPDARRMNFWTRLEEQWRNGELQL